MAQVLAEQAQGRFKMAALLEGQAAGSSKAPPVADWVGPLETFDSPTAGRGLRATRAVPEGQLLLVERALAVAQVRTCWGGVIADLRFTRLVCCCRRACAAGCHPPLRTLLA